METLDIDKVIEDFAHLTLEDKEYVAEVMRKRIIEERRESILHRAREATESLSRGAVKTGGFQELYEDLEGDLSRLGYWFQAVLQKKDPEPAATAEEILGENERFPNRAILQRIANAQAER